MSRRGFTLVELLVVAGIFAMLFAMVLNGARPGTSGQVRRAAHQVASVLLSAQSKALGSPAGSGILLKVSGSEAFVTTVAAADNLPLITGLCTSGMPSTDEAIQATSATVGISPLNADPEDLADGYKIRFHVDGPRRQAETPWFRFDAVVGGTTTVSFRGGQTNANTIWPKLPSSGTFSVTIARYPSEGEVVYDLPKAVAIDLRFSGVGDGATFDPNWSNLSGKGAVALGFDSLGAVDVVMQRVLSGTAPRPIQPVVPTQPVYLLVAARSAVEKDENTLARNDSMWVAIHPQSGRASVAANVIVTGTAAADLRAARESARQGLAVGK